MKIETESSGSGLAALIVIWWGASIARNVDLKRVAVQRLREVYGVNVSFKRKQPIEEGGSVTGQG